MNPVDSLHIAMARRILFKSPFGGMKKLHIQCPLLNGKQTTNNSGGNKKRHGPDGTISSFRTKKPTTTCQGIDVNKDGTALWHYGFGCVNGLDEL